MVIEWKINEKPLEVKFNGMEQKWKGNEMD